MSLKRRRQRRKKRLRYGSLPHISHNAPLAQTRKAAQGFCFTKESEFQASGNKTSRKACSGVGLETGRFQPPIEQERFGRRPDGAEGFSR